LLIQKAGSTKLTVNSTGIDVTGVITTDGLTSVGGFISIGADGAGDDFRFYGDTSGRYMEWVSAADSLLFRDGAKALFGNGSDLQIYHDGSHSYVSDQGTGNLRIYANDLVLANNDGSETFLYGVNGGGVSISYANSAKVTTTSTGVDVTGTVTADGLTVETAAGTSGTIALLRNSSSASNGNAAYLDFKFDNSFSGSNVDVQIGAIKTNAGNEESAFVVKTTEGAGTPTERMRIDASGNVGIGVVPTLGRLHVKAASGVVGWFETTGLSGALGISNSGTFGMQIDTASSSGFLTFTKGSGSTEFGRFDTDGNLLVGKTAADGGVNGGEIRSNGETYLTATSAQPLALNRKSTDGAIATFAKDGVTVGSIGANNGAPYLSGPLAGGIKLSYYDATNGIIFPVTTTGAIANGTHDLGYSAAKFRDLYLSEGINLSADDAGGVGSNTIGFKHTGHTAGYSAAIEASYGGDFRADLIFKINTSQANTAPIEVARFNKSGNLLVGTTDSSPYTTIEGFVVALNNGSKSAACFGADNVASRTVVNIVNPNGSVGSITTNASATAYNTSSDQRLKDNIVDAPSASDDIDAIQVRSFDWKSDGSHQKYGMVAQELQTVAPEAVSAPEDPEEMMGVDYSKLVPMMLKEIQSLRARVAQLES